MGIAQSTIPKGSGLMPSLQSEERLAELGRHAAGVAHGLANLLTNISLKAQILELQSSDPNASEHARGIRYYIEEAREILERIHRFANPEYAPLPNRVNILETLTSVWKEVQFRHLMSGDSAVKFECSLDCDEEPLVLANRSELKEIIANLIDNSLRAMPDGGRLSARISRRNGDVQVEIADTGHGIPARMIDSIFEPFVSTRSRAGSGLGLTVCRDVILNHGGSIELSSNPGSGTRVTFRLPAGD